MQFQRSHKGIWCDFLCTIISRKKYKYFSVFFFFPPLSSLLPWPWYYFGLHTTPTVSAQIYCTDCKSTKAGISYINDANVFFYAIKASEIGTG